ncbi:MAG: hypothetical protein V1775_15525 [Bacteroidota bacterium]
MNTLSSIVNLSSVSCIKELTTEQIQALQSVGITRISDLLHFDPINNAKMLMSLVKDEIVIDLNKANILDDSLTDTPVNQISSLPVKALKGIGDPFAKIFKDSFGVSTIEQLAVFKPYTDAERLILKHANEFSEPSSAPEELMPKIVGSVGSQSSYSNFIKERRVSFKNLELVLDGQRVFVDSRLAGLFLTGNRRITQGLQIPEIQLGYISKLTQKWINYGTHLGEVIHSLPLAPGESRNIAVIDWKSRQKSARSESTEANEQLTNELFHKRALDEVTRSTAAELQKGGTNIEASTLAVAGAGVLGAGLAGGIAGVLPGAAIGGIVGAVAGAPIADGGGLTIAGGALAGAVIGFGVGAAAGIGVSLVGTANQQLGTIQSDSKGDRTIDASMSQNIDEIIKQKSSSIRSLWSSVIVTDEKAENEQLTTRNVTNYNHSHALTIQYFEVLQHYRTELCLSQAEPFLLMPFAPLDFTFDLIADFWSILKFGVRDINLKNDFEKLINNVDDSIESSGIIHLDIMHIGLQRTANNVNTFMGFEIKPQPEVNVLGIDQSKSIDNNQAIFAFPAETEANKLTGVQIEGLAENETVYIYVFARMKDENNRKIPKTIRNVQFKADENGLVTYPFSLVESNVVNPENRRRSIDELEKYFNAHRYFFTRLLLLAIEKEQLTDLVEALILRVPVADNSNSRYAGSPRGRGTYPEYTENYHNSSNRSYTSVLSDLISSGVRNLLTGIIHQNRSPKLPLAVLFDSLNEALNQIGESIAENAAVKPKTEADKRRIADAIQKIIDAWFARHKDFFKDKKEVDLKIKKLLNKAFLVTDDFNSFDDYIHLSEFIDSTPIAITGNTLMFKMKKVVDKEVLQNSLLKNNSKIKELRDYPDEIYNYLGDVLKNKEQHTVSSDIYLPTSGVFAEAILGRSNASEKIDITRYINWQDMPIPHLAPAINALSQNQHNNNVLDTSPTIPGNVLNVVNPPALPDPTGMAGVLNAIQNGNIFRDMSKSDQLVTVMGNLSNLAQSMAQQAGSLAGQAQSDALKAATEIGKQVAQLASQAASQAPNAPKSFTEKGGAANSLEKLISGQGNGATSQIPDEFKNILGIGGIKGNSSQSPLNSVPFLNEKKDIADLIGDFSKSGIEELKLNNDGGNIEFKKRASFLTSNDPDFSSTERDSTVNTPILSEREQIQSIVARAANSAEGSLSDKDKIEIVRLFKADFERNIKPNVIAKAGDFSALRCELTKLVSWQADIQTFGLDDDLIATNEEAKQLTRQSMLLALANAIERAKNNNNIGQIKTAINIAADAQLLGLDDAAFNVSNIVARLNLSFIVSSSFDSTISDGQGKSLEVRVLLKIDSNNGAPMAGAGIGITVEGGTVQPSTGSSNDEGIFNCTITCIDRPNLRISGLVADLGLDSLQANFEVL